MTAVAANPGPVCIALLRGFQVTQGDLPVALPFGAQRLVAFLALQDRPVLRPFVAGNLWLDKPEELACASLRSALWQLRRNGLDVVKVSRNHLELSDRLDVDVWETVAEARQVIEGRTGEATRLHRLLTGDLLPDWYEDWVVVERERIRQLRLHALEALGQRLIDQDRPAQAIEAGLAAVAADPLRESAHRVVDLRPPGRGQPQRGAAPVPDLRAPAGRATGRRPVRPHADPDRLGAGPGAGHRHRLSGTGITPGPRTGRRRPRT